MPCLTNISRIAAESEIATSFNSSASHYSSCYELFGCDVFLDADLTPHLLEVNVSPSLTGSTPIDKVIKGKLISDLFHLVRYMHLLFAARVRKHMSE
jgi:hypothetical protein